MIDEFEKRDTVVISIAQEDTDLESHAKMPKKIRPKSGSYIVADLNRSETEMYDRTTAYLIDKQGVVRQVFPMLTHFRSAWGAILGEIDAME